ncbi:DISARM system SNF2-like helicase DrmD [Candidatus Sumerlaeota bacterium]
MDAITYIAAKVPEQGQLVRVRQRPFVVSDVRRSSLPSSPLDPSGSAQHVVSLTSVEDDALGEELQVIWEIEPDAHVFEKMALPEPTGFDDPIRLDAFLNAVIWGASSSADKPALQAPFRSGIEIEDYQLDPVVRAIQMPRVNLLIADDVGLGKTIETGLVLQELITLHRVRKVLVVCPAHLQIHWRDQMREKFGLEFRIVDRKLRQELRRKRGLHVNPWKHFPRLITSIDYLKLERPLRLFREALPQEGEAVYPRRFDMLIVDEAHNIAPSGRGKYAKDSLRTAAVRMLAPHFEHKLFLSATPHNGYLESFTALLELLDNQRFSRGVRPDLAQLQQVMVRRLKSELRGWSGAPKFPRRSLKAIEVDYSDEEQQIHRILETYTRSRLKGSKGNTERIATEFVLKTLKKRLFSSPAAFLTTIIRHEKTLQTAVVRRATVRKPTLGILQQQIARVEEEHADEEEFEELTQDTVESSTRLFHDLSTEEFRLLREMKKWAEMASSRIDSKTEELVRWLSHIVKPGGKWSDERVIIFTEYRATQKWLQGILAAEKLTQNDRLMVLHGGLDSDYRERVKNAFQAPLDRSPVRILLATDVASEGIDLQNYCHRLIHFEVPWNPNRMEQRNGRIDRHGQRSNEVNIFHFVGKGFEERLAKFNAGDLHQIKPGNLQGDMEFLMIASRKVSNIRTDLGKVGPVIAQQVEEAMLGHRHGLDTTHAEQDATPAREMLRFDTNLQRQVMGFHEKLIQTQHDLHLTPENIQSVVEIALELAEQPPLEEADAPGIWPDPKGERARCPAFRLPLLTGSWASCAEGLADPHTGEIRPIVFDHALAKGNQDVVLCHLNHRLVQMSLRLLRAEVWSKESGKKLNRVTARIVPDNALASPALVAHARLVIIGSDSQRLHEEVITAGGRIREGRFSRLNVGETQGALDAALSDEPADSVKEELVGLWETNSKSLRLALESRMNSRFESLMRSLAERSQKEADNITAVLNELKTSIEGQLNLLDQPKQLDWIEQLDGGERDQLDRDIDNLRARLNQIPKEIEQERQIIKDRFANPQARLFPVAVTWLVPQQFAG